MHKLKTKLYINEFTGTFLFLSIIFVFSERETISILHTEKLQQVTIDQ